MNPSMQESVTHSRLAPHQVKPLVMSAKDVADYEQLASIGIGFEPNYLNEAVRILSRGAMDATWAAVPSAVDRCADSVPSELAPRLRQSHYGRSKDRRTDGYRHRRQLAR